MTDQQNSTLKSPIDAIANAISDLQGKIKIPEAAREFVTRSAATASETRGTAADTGRKARAAGQASPTSQNRATATTESRARGTATDAER